MLRSLTIQNYALISRLEIDFPQGFSVITGETGAGKSIILGALSLILGQRADARTVKQNETKCLIEGVFDISSYQLNSFFEERDLEYDAEHCILRRELLASGKSRAFINDTPVALADLKDLGAFLIDVHSQHQNLLLGDDRFQLQVLDVLSGNKDLRATYKEAYQQYISIRKELKDLKARAAEDAVEEDYIRFQFNQLEEAKLQAGELSEWQTEAETLSNIEEIKTALFRTEQLLSGEDRSVVGDLKESLTAMRSLSKVYPASTEIVERIETAYLDLKDLAMDLSARQDRLELNPDRLQWLTDRLDLLYSLQQKHKADSIEALIELRNQLDEKLQTIEHSDERIAELEKAEAEALAKVMQLAEGLTDSRTKAGRLLEKQLVEKVSALGMPNMQFVCELTPKAAPDSNGMDEVSFLFSANKNVSLKPVATTASGGEISRLMLGIKALIAGAMALPTIIFDEIDTGVSGEIADKMGGIMQDLGQVMQVVTITHLPQIAGKGETHYFVYKQDNEETTETGIRLLSEEERVTEIAQMLSGSKITEAALENARALLK